MANIQLPMNGVAVPPNLTGKILKVVTKDFTEKSMCTCDLSNYLSKKLGGEVSATTAIGINNQLCSEYSICIGGGNRTITKFSVAENDRSWAGGKQFRLISGDNEAMTWHLKTISGIKPGFVYNVRLLNNYMFVGNVLSVLSAQNKISVDAMPTNLRVSEQLSDPYLSTQPFYGSLSAHGLRAHSSPTQASEYTGGPFPPVSCFVDFNFDGNSIWFVGHPEIGDLSSYCIGAHAEGLYSNASQAYSHAEGVMGNAVGKYSHVEGQYNFAGWGAHAEGIDVSALGYCTHAEGNKTIAKGYGAHTEGNMTSAYGNYSHAEGNTSKAIGNYSHAEGSGNAQGDYSHAEGQLTRAEGACSHASGIKSVAKGNYQFVWNGDKNRTVTVTEEGAFSINPKNGISGLYIDGSNFIAAVLKAVQGMSNDQKNSLKAALNL